MNRKNFRTVTGAVSRKKDTVLTPVESSLNIDFTMNLLPKR